MVGHRAPGRQQARDPAARGDGTRQGEGVQIIHGAIPGFLSSMK